MTQRLEGARLVVTRPDAAEGRLARRLAQEGARVLAFPALEIVPLAGPAPVGAFDAALFTSPAAVHHGLSRLDDRLPASLLAPGAGTSERLIAAGAGEVRAPARGAGLAALLDSLPADFLAEKRLLLVCGRPLNRRSLRALAARGAEVTPFPVYARQAVSDPRPLAGWIRSGEADVIMASSTAAVAALAALPATGAARLGWIASSKRVARAVERAGAKVVAVAASAEATDMSAAAIRWWQSEGGNDGA